jgi:succinoglycan biosynthesis protein ExoH
MTLLLFAAQRTGLVERRIFDLAGGNMLAFADAIFGINHLPFNGPIYFLYDLFVCFLVSPVIYSILRFFPWGGLFLIIILWLSGGSNFIWVRGDILLGFYVGGFLSIHKIDLEISKRDAVLIISVFITGCLALAWHSTHVPPADIDNRIALELNLLRIIGPVAMWSYATLISETEMAQKLAKFGGIALFIFCSHEPVVRLLGRAFFSVAQQSAAAYYPLFYVTAPIAVILMALAAKAVLLRFSPLTLAMLSGGRLGGGADSRDRAAARVARTPGPQPS